MQLNLQTSIKCESSEFFTFSQFSTHEVSTAELSSHLQTTRLLLPSNLPLLAAGRSFDEVMFGKHGDANSKLKLKSSADWLKHVASLNFCNHVASQKNFDKKKSELQKACMSGKYVSKMF